MSGNFVQFFCRQKVAVADETRYRVLDRNLKIVSNANPINFPEDPAHPSQLPDLILPGNFSGAAGPEFLFYWAA